MAQEQCGQNVAPSSAMLAGGMPPRQECEKVSVTPRAPPPHRPAGPLALLGLTGLLSLPAVRDGPQDSVEHGLEVFAQVFGEEPQDEVAALL